MQQLINLNYMKKILSAAIITVLTFAATASASYVDDYAVDNMLDDPSAFTDISISHPNLRAINSSVQFGIIEGYEDGTFGPDREINRAELTKIMVYEYLGEEPDPTLYHNCFNDVNQEWFAPYVCYAYEQEWVEGYDDGDFRPANPVNRVEALKIIMNVGIPEDEWPDPTDADMAAEMPADLDMNQWYAGYARMAIVKELVDGQHVTQDQEGNVFYYPGDNMTRKEVVEMLWRITVWIVERDSYGQAMAELGCAQITNPEMETYIEEQQAEVLYQVFEIYGFDQTETDVILEKYFYDSIGDAKLEFYAAEKCGLGVVYDNWIFEDAVEV
jgi:hypothetical protein